MMPRQPLLQDNGVCPDKRLGAKYGPEESGVTAEAFILRFFSLPPGLVELNLAAFVSRFSDTRSNTRFSVTTPFRNVWRDRRQGCSQTQAAALCGYRGGRPA